LGPPGFTPVNAAAPALFHPAGTASGISSSADLQKRKTTMSMLKVIEVLAESPEGFEAAASAAVTQAAESVRNIKSIYIKDMNAEVVDGEITTYRVNAKISFMLDGQSAT
jgi:flavin-binding protein dodecin